MGSRTRRKRSPGAPHAPPGAWWRTLALDRARPRAPERPLRRRRLRATLRGASAQRAAAGDRSEALALAATLLDLDPLDETAHQSVVRLHLQRGDVRAARVQYESCRMLLDRELGVEPLPETAELGAAIAAAERAIVVRTPLTTLAAIPPELLRPRVLVGREAART
ncbi:MAG: bacterial transcriptional activator domain-containing protein, partial [Trueperaceae bacterium]